MSRYFVGIVVKEVEPSKLIPFGLRCLDLETLSTYDYPFTLETLNTVGFKIFTIYKDMCIRLLNTGRLLDAYCGEYWYNGTYLVFPESGGLSISVLIQVDDFGGSNRLGVIYDCLKKEVYVVMYPDSFNDWLAISNSIIPINIKYTDSSFFLSEVSFCCVHSNVISFRESIKLSQLYEYKGWSILFDRILVVDKLDIKDFIISDTIHTLVLGSNALTGVKNLVIPKTVEYLVYPELLNIIKMKTKRKTIYIDAEKQYTVPFLTKVLATLEDCSIYDIKETTNILASRIKECGIGIEFI
jgi:hypothetical protein